MKKLILTILLILIIPAIVNAQIQDCVIAQNNPDPAQYSIRGYVSKQGHFALTLNENITYSYKLFCDINLPETGGDILFSFSNPEQTLNDGQKGTGHISVQNIPTHTDFTGGVSLGISSDTCVFQNETCATNQFCVFKTPPNQGHIADCNTDSPMIHAFQWNLCCASTVDEICNDGIDNSGNGLIDCADPACQQMDNVPPQECTGNNQRTEDCVIGINGNNPVYDPACLDDLGNAFYCSYGDYEENDQGFCCPAGFRARFFPAQGWQCREFTQCGDISPNPLRECDFDFRNNKQNWLNSLFQGDLSDWCVSRMPNYYNPVDFTQTSMGCCFVSAYGGVGFYYKADNVKVFGVE